MYIPQIPVAPELEEILQNIPNTYLVGGCVRDHLLGIRPKDIDIEVYKLDYPSLEAKLSKYGKVDLVGKAFGVIKLTIQGKNNSETYDFSLARKDSKIENGVGHKAFDVTTDPNMTVLEGCARRDLTINSMAYDPRTSKLIDPFNGYFDLGNRVLRHTTVQFVEDPLRVLRVMQFAARFDFVVADETTELCKKMKGTFDSLPKERVGEEFFKMLTKGTNIKQGLQFLKDCEWIEHFPEIKALDGCNQDLEDWHPEGDAFEHTGYCCNAMARLDRWKKLSERERYTHMLGILCHDLGKPATTKQEFKPKLNRMAWVSPGHDKAGEEPAKSLLARIHTPKDVIRQVIPLVTHHMDHLQVTTDTQIRQLSVHMKDNSIFNLGFVTEADHSGRPPLPAKQPAEMQYILDRAKELGCLYSRPKPILQGKHIAQWSALEPGKTYGVLCNAAYEAQLKGHILDEQTAKEWFKANRGKVLENAKLAPPRLLDGKQLLPLYGGKPGPELGQLHRELFDLQIDGHLKTEEDAWKFVHANATKFKIEPHNLPVQMEVEI